MTLARQALSRLNSGTETPALNPSAIVINVIVTEEEDTYICTIVQCTYSIVLLLSTEWEYAT
jgi:hypothetical protein